MFGTFSLFLYPSIEDDDDDDADIILASYSNERGDAHDAAVNAVSHSTIRQIALSFVRPSKRPVLGLGRASVAYLQVWLKQIAFWEITLCIVF